MLHGLGWQNKATIRYFNKNYLNFKWLVWKWNIFEIWKSTDLACSCQNCRVWTKLGCLSCGICLAWTTITNFLFVRNAWIPIGCGLAQCKALFHTAPIQHACVARNRQGETGSKTKDYEVMKVSSSSSYSFNVRDPKTHTVFQASALARVGPPVIFLQAQRSCAISSFIPIAFMSLLTQLLHVFLGAPLSTTPITFILVHFFTQLFSSFRSTCPNHLNLPLCILFSTHSMPKRFKSSSLRFLSFKDTPHILLTIILSALLIREGI